MDLLNKISKTCAVVSEKEQKYSNYETLQDMIKSVNISTGRKWSIINNSQIPSTSEQKRQIDVVKNDNPLQYQRSQQLKHDKYQRSNVEHKTYFEEINFKKNVQNSEEKMQNKLEKNVLKDNNYSDRNISKEITNSSKKCYDDERQVIEELQRILSLKFLTYEDAKKLMEFLFHHKIPLKIKVFIIIRLDDECTNNRDVVRKAFDKSMTQLLESLLEKYCSTVSIFGRKNVQIENKARSPKELCLLSPLTKLFSNIACYPHTRFLHIHLISLLVNAVTFVASNVENIHRKIVLISQGKSLQSKVFAMDPKDSSLLLSNLIGLRLDDWVSGAYEIILYGGCGKETPQNINEEIIKIQPSMDCTKLEHAQNTLKETTNECDKKYVTIIRVKAPKFFFMYLGRDWDRHLQEISKVIQKVTQEKTESFFRNGDIVGFHHDDVEFENTFLKPVPFLRGLIVSQQKGNVLIWAMDIGTWVHARRDKLISLAHSTLNALEPLISIGQFKGPVCDIDEEFLIFALSILRHAAYKSNEIAKKTFMPDAGENLLLLAEHHNSAIRRFIFDLLLILVKFREGCIFLHRKGFDLLLTGKIEFWAHLVRSGLCQVPRMKTEILVMAKILFEILSINSDKNWCGLQQAKRAMKILLVGQDQRNEVFQGILNKIREVEQDERKDVHSNVNAEKINTTEENHQNIPSQSTQTDLKNNGQDISISKKKIRVKEEEAFVYESMINIKSDLFTHIIVGKERSDIRPLEMAEEICGLLNNNIDGCIYLGLSLDSVVSGITLKENDIKTFIEDVKIIMKKFVKPSLSDSNYEMKFSPVLENRKGRFQVKEDVYVIQIKLYPHKRVVYSLHDGTKYYTRKGTTTIEHNTEKKRNFKERKVSDEKSVNTINESHNSEIIKSGTITSSNVKEEIPSSDFHKGDTLIAKEDNEESSQSPPEISSPGNLITPVFHFIKKLIPNASNEQ